MKIYVVTSGKQYYSCSGCQNWTKILSTLEEATKYCEADPLESDDWRVIAEIDLETLTFKEVFREGSAYPNY
jgi:hypothetical protein